MQPNKEGGDETQLLMQKLFPGVAPLQWKRVSHGGNNRSYVVQAAGDSFFVKQYFRHPADNRDRLGTEFGFLSLLREHGVSCVPTPIARDEATGSAVYSLLQGMPMQEEQINASHVGECLEFICKLQELRQEGKPPMLPRAAEGCFSVQDHIDICDRRLTRLASLEDKGGVHGEASAFVRSVLLPAWRDLKEGILTAYDQSGLELRKPLPRKGLCISPSDFGFHNALTAPNGRLQFIDFEYAGLDDPVKLLCDFFHQPKIPVDSSHLTDFSRQFCQRFLEPNETLRRMKLLFPLHGLKWCCIMLNVFLEEGFARRSFASDRIGRDRLESQLLLARKKFNSLELSRPMEGGA
jgi:hypothetical protein